MAKPDSLMPTVGASVLGAMLAGPMGAVVAGGVAFSLTAQQKIRQGMSISRVTLPPEGITQQRGVTYFAVHFVDAQGNTWHVLRRYNDFRAFYDQVHNVEIRAHFPGKTWPSPSGALLEQRRRDLEYWTQDVFSCFMRIGIPKKLEDEFQDFLFRGAGQVVPAHNPQAPPQAPQTFSVEVPRGVMAGQTLTVRSPEGESLQIIVPEGSGPGAMLQVEAASRQARLLKAQPASASAKMILNISVPPNVSPGQKIAVKVPDGREITIQVPHAGEVQMEFDAQAGSLQLFNLDTPEKGSGEQFQIVVPAGVRPGQIMNIQVPDGRQLPFAVPAGKIPGDELLLCLDASGHRLLLA